MEIKPNNPKLFRIATVPISLNILVKGQLRFLNQHLQVTAISGSGEELDEVHERENVKIYPLEMQRQISPVKDLISLFRLYRYFRKEKPAIIHSITPKAGLLSMLAGKMAGVPIRIHTFTGLIFPTRTGIMQKLLIRMDQLLCWAATNIYPEGNGVKQDLINFKITTKPLNVIANGNVNGIDLGYFNPDQISEAQKATLKNELGISKDDFVFIFVGRLVGDKGINELVKAFKDLELYNRNEDEKSSPFRVGEKDFSKASPFRAGEKDFWQDVELDSHNQNEDEKSSPFRVGEKDFSKASPFKSGEEDFWQDVKLDSHNQNEDEKSSPFRVGEKDFSFKSGEEDFFQPQTPKLLLVGPFETELDPLLPETLTEIESNPNIISVGFQSDVRPYFAISNALVFPSYREGFPNVVMQAGAMGLPSIVTNINGCNEIIREGENGTIIPVKNVDAILNAMQKMVEDKDFYHEAKKNARPMIQSRYEQSVVWNALLEEYNLLINQFNN